MKRCWPSDEAIIQKIKDAKRDYEGAAKPEEKRLIDIVFLMMNAKRDRQETMKRLLRAEGFNTVVTTKDLVVDSEEMEVGVIADMEFARRAAVFVGNGVSRHLVPLGSIVVANAFLVVFTYK